MDPNVISIKVFSTVTTLSAMECASLINGHKIDLNWDACSQTPAKAPSYT